ncbi:NAD-dependent epimerase/dehydratase family protein [Adhaeribacter rhizoryzae]|uniref:NAD-dependent epimerase/dehydratase family protein n=1 Tax=Adhaeribacter rhizoryzae TaxID=2607907 RepID=A0A5M6D3N9_9BACT|nr:NAD-dependent epimerase/dehydratase family protein [Adhaeribacter rhizoryzae]KAA5540349.1 NAD-dependent epimerase/dehydratase family protein [Adhaeribacter rhizoryzae]
MIFITGGTGLIGSFLIRKLLADGASLKVLYRQHIPTEFKNESRIEWIKGDILDTTLMRDTIREVSQVYHCAGLVSYAPQDAALLKEINVTGTANIVDACLENPGVKLCHVSSVAAIGHVKGKQILTEETKWDLNAAHSAYANSKYFGELEVWRGVAEGLQAVIVNPSVVLGPASDWSRSSTQLFKYVFEERKFYTRGSANFVDVRDVIKAMTALMQADISGDRFILNAGLLSYEAFFNQVAGCLQKKAPSVKVPGVLTEIIWRAEAVRSFFTRKRPLITKETARIAKKKHMYSNEKIKTKLGLEFVPLTQTINWCCQELNQLHRAQLA